MNLRIGHGYDVHILTEGRTLMLGCTEIPYHLGLLGHSDADVLSHAIADALLGASALGDIGYHFPDNSPSCKNMAGSVLLAKVCELLEKSGYEIVNVDATIVAQKPRLSPYIQEMRSNTARALGTDIEQINIKATTEEGRGITGKADAMCAHAVCLISKKSEVKL